MASFYRLMRKNEEIGNIHKQMIDNGLNNVANQDELIEILGGIDYILAFILEKTKTNTNLLSLQQLNKIKEILSPKESEFDNMETVIPSLAEEIDDILNEIEEREETKHLILPIDNQFVVVHDDDDDDDDIDLLSNDYNLYQRSLINGYFIEFIRNIPSHIINNIIDLCVLYTFIANDDDENEIIIFDDDDDDDDDDAEFGHCQSPINIISAICNKTKIMNDDEFESNPLKFNYPSKVTNCTILNNGHTVQINIDYKQNECTLSIHDKIYKLKQFHFHTPSEHTIDGNQYEMEMHLVHTDDNDNIAVLGFIFSTKQKYNKPKLSISKSRRHLHLTSKSMLMRKESELKTMQESDEETDDLETDDEFDDDEYDENCKTKQKEKENDFLSQFWDQLPSKKTDSEILLKHSLNFDYLFETSSNNFVKNIKSNEINIDMEIFEYKGSLTTPPYTEGVQWLVSKHQHFISCKQLEILSKCWNNENNARSVQNYFGRTVSLRSKSSLKVIS